MRKGEKAKIKLSKKRGFGVKDNIDKLKFPKGFEEPGELRDKLLSHGVIYEVKLVDFQERADVDYDGNLLKTFIQKPKKRDWEHPKEVDEIIVNLKISDDSGVLYEKENWSVSMNDPAITPVMKKIFESMKKTEKCSVLCKPKWIKDNDKQIIELLGEKYNENKELTINVDLLSFIKVEQLFKDKTVFKRLLRKGKKGNVNLDSVVLGTFNLLIKQNSETEGILQ